MAAVLGWLFKTYFLNIMYEISLSLMYESKYKWQGIVVLGNDLLPIWQQNMS